MKGNQSAGTGNIKSFGDGKKVEKGTDPRPRPRGHAETFQATLNIKDFSRTKQTAGGC